MASLRSRFAAVFSCVAALATAAACASGGSDVDAGGGASSSSSSGVVDGTSSSSSGESSSGRSNDAYAEAPVLQAIEPSRAFVGTAGPTVVVRGKNFVPRTIVQLDGAALETSFIDTTELRATLPTERLAAPGVLMLTVGTSPPGGGASSSMDFTVENPAPTLTRVKNPDPPTALMGSPALTMQLEGAGFVTGAKVRWAGAEIPTTFVSATQLTAAVEAALLADSGIFDVDVDNPAPGGGTSAKLTFVVSNPTVQLTSIEPASTTVGAGDLMITLHGGGFVVGKSKVSFNGTELTPTVGNATTMTVIVPSSQFDSVGALAVAVQNPNPGGGLSPGQIFSVVNPAPRTTSMAPNSAVQGANDTPVVLSGENFVAASQVSVNGDPVATEFVGINELRFTVPKNRLGTGGLTLDIRVENSGPGGGTATLPFKVRNGQPTIDSVVADGVESPGFVMGATVTVAVKGAGFIATSKVNVNGVDITPNTFEATLLTATFTPTQAALAFKVTEVSAPDSNTVNLTACGALTAGANAMPSTNVLLTSNDPLFSAAQTATVYAGSGSACGAAGVSFRATVQPYRAYIVQNTSGRAAVLEAWASCAGPLDDAYLALYKRGDIPTTEAQREQCSGRLSNGGAFPSFTPAYNTQSSGFCPGLVSGKGAQPIDVCETWVAYIQQDTTTAGHTPPQALNIDLWPQ